MRTREFAAVRLPNRFAPAPEQRGDLAVREEELSSRRIPFRLGCRILGSAQPR